MGLGGASLAEMMGQAASGQRERTPGSLALGRVPVSLQPWESSEGCGQKVSSLAPA